MRQCQIKDLKPGMTFCCKGDLYPEEETFYVLDILEKCPRNRYYRVLVRQYINGKYVQKFFKDFNPLRNIIISNDVVIIDELGSYSNQSKK